MSNLMSQYKHLPETVHGGYAHGPVDDYQIPPYDFSGKVAMVTGASQGIGRHTAIGLARCGATVIVTSRSQGGPETVDMILNDEQCQKAGAKAEFMELDIRTEEKVKSVIDAIVDKHGALHFAVNNAGISGMNAPIENQTEENYDYIFNTNVKGTLFCMKHEIKAMRKNTPSAHRANDKDADTKNGATASRMGYGRIVNIGSGAAFVAFPAAGIYVASKHALLGLTRNAAVELAGDTDIRVNMIAPGVVKTNNYEIFSEGKDEIKKLMINNHATHQTLMPEDCVAATLFMLSDGAFFSVGSTLMIEGGYATL